MLAGCGKSLLGVTVLPKPRVAKSVMVDVLREHNKILMLLRSDLGALAGRVGTIETEVAAHKETMAGMQAQIDTNRGDIDSVTARTGVIEETCTALTQKLEQVDAMADTIAEHTSQIHNLEEVSEGASRGERERENGGGREGGIVSTW